VQAPKFCLPPRLLTPTTESGVSGGNSICTPKGVLVRSAAAPPVPAMFPFATPMWDP